MPSRRDNVEAMTDETAGLIVLGLFLLVGAALGLLWLRFGTRSTKAIATALGWSDGLVGARRMIQAAGGLGFALLVVAAVRYLLFG